MARSPAGCVDDDWCVAADCRSEAGKTSVGPARDQCGSCDHIGRIIKCHKESCFVDGGRTYCTVTITVYWQIGVVFLPTMLE